MQPLDQKVHYGTTHRSHLDVPDIQLELLPDKVQLLRSKLHQKAKAEPKFRFYALYDRIYRKDVLEAAWKHVGKKRKAPGIDGIRAEDILAEEGGVERLIAGLHEELRTKSYRPGPVKRTLIPKADGKKRPLGIPNLRDRVVQMAVVLILDPIFEADFHDCSHGFRKGRKAHHALEEIRTQIKEGKTSVYDADLQGYFLLRQDFGGQVDTIPHDKLLACLRMRIVDQGVLGLIRAWLKAPVIENDDQTGKPKPPRKNDGKGTPQGGVMTPRTQKAIFSRAG